MSGRGAQSKNEIRLPRKAAGARTSSFFLVNTYLALKKEGAGSLGEGPPAREAGRLGLYKSPSVAAPFTYILDIYMRGCYAGGLEVKRWMDHSGAYTS